MFFFFILINSFFCQATFTDSVKEYKLFVKESLHIKFKGFFNTGKKRVVETTKTIDNDLVLFYDNAGKIMQPDNTQNTTIVQKIPILNKLWPLLPKWMTQGIKFGMVGVLNTGVDFGIYWLLTRFILVGPQFAVPSKTISYTLGVINSYFWNKNFTFRAKGQSIGKFILFFSINLIAIGINSGVMWVGLHLFNQSELVSLLLATCFTLVWNFTTSKFIVFKK